MRRRAGFSRRRRLGRVKRRSGRISRRAFRRPHRLNRFRRRRTRRGGRIRTGFGITPFSKSRHGRNFLPSFRSRIRAVMRMSTPIMYAINSGGSQASNENSVEYTTFDFASPQDLYKIGNTISANFPNSRFSGYTGYTTNPLVVSNINGEYILGSMSVDLHLKNQTTNNVRLDFWEMYPKQFATTSDFASLITNCVRNGFNDRLLVNNVTAPDAATAYIYPCVWPQQNPKLMAFYKLARHKSITILPGQSFTYKLAWRSPKLVNMERVNNVNGIDYKGITRHLLMRQIGDVAWDVTSTSSAYSATRIDFAWTLKYSISVSTGLVAKMGLVTDNQPSTGNNTYTINPVTGNENLTITNVGGVGVSTIQPITTVH